jgi:hypothetical protein
MNKQQEKSDTPRTDAKEDSIAYVGGPSLYFVESDFCRQIERELNQSQRDAAAWADGALEAAGTLRTERDELRAKLDSLRNALEHLLERCDTSDDFRYGTLSTSFVRDVASEALQVTR